MYRQAYIIQSLPIPVCLRHENLQQNQLGTALTRIIHRIILDWLILNCKSDV